MRSKAIPIVIINFIVQFSPIAHSCGEPVGITAKGSAQEVFLSVSPPQKDRLTLVSVVPVTVGGEVLGGLAAYDDLATARPADYLELYNKEGALLVVTWFDRFGIERSAMDRALAENADEFEGVFVLS